MSTTKLSRKEMVAEDPVHRTIVRLFSICQENRTKIGVAIVVLVALIIGGYLGYLYLENRDMKSQTQLAKGIDFFNAQIAPDAAADPYAKGPAPVFRSNAEKFKAAEQAFSSLTSGFSYGSTPVIARYYLGLTQLELGKKQEAMKNFESVAGNSQIRTIAYLAKKVQASVYFGSGNYQSARDILDGMIKDPKCDLPKEELSIQLAKILAAQGKSAEAIKVLREANDRSDPFGVFKQQVVAEMEKLQKSSATDAMQKLLKP